MVDAVGRYDLTGADRVIGGRTWQRTVLLNAYTKAGVLIGPADIAPYQPELGGRMEGEVRDSPNGLLLATLTAEGVGTFASLEFQGGSTNPTNSVNFITDWASESGDGSNKRTYTFVTTDPPAFPRNVLIGATMGDSLVNLVHAINLTGAEGVHYGPGTNANPAVRAEHITGETDNIMIFSKIAGEDGNTLCADGFADGDYIDPQTGATVSEPEGVGFGRLVGGDQSGLIQLSLTAGDVENDWAPAGARSANLWYDVVGIDSAGNRFPLLEGRVAYYPSITEVVAP